MPKISLFLLALAVLTASCHQDTKAPVAQSENIESEFDSHFVVTDSGDTVFTSVPIPAEGKRIDTDSVAQPRMVPLKAQPKVAPPAHVHVFPAGKPKVAMVPAQLTVIMPGKNGVPLPDTMPAAGKLVPTRQPKPIPALSMRMKDAAIYDIQYLDVDQGMVSSSIFSMLEDSRGNLWFGTDGGVSRYDGHSFTHYTTEEGLSRNWVHSILEDSRGDLWFGTSGGGVSRYDGRSFTHYTTKEGLNDNLVISMLEDSQGNLWFGTFDGGVSLYDGNANGGQGSFAHYTTEEGLLDNWVISILEDRQGNIWFGSPNSGVSRYEREADGGQGSFTHYTTEEGLSHNVVRSILEDSRGDLWFGTTGGGVSRYHRGADGGQGSFTHFTTEEGLSHNIVRSILEDNEGKLWFGTEGGGVSRYDRDANGGQGSFTHFTTKEGLIHNDVYAMLKDSQGKLWFGTIGGLSCYTPNTNVGPVSFTNYTTEEGLSHNWVRSILEDQNKNIWIATQMGITMLMPPSGGPAAISGSHSVTVSEKIPLRPSFTFGKLDGLNWINFQINSACADRQNRIWWGSKYGVTMLDLNKFELPDEAPNKLHLSQIDVAQTFVDYRRLNTDSTYQSSLAFGKSLAESFDSVAPFRNYPVSMSLPHHLDHLTFHFSAIDWAAPHKLQYSYLVEGLDDRWSPLTTESKADYRNLSPGDYTFKVKAIGGAGNWSEVFEYPFRIRPPWWAAWWALLIYGALGLYLLYYIYRFLLARKLEHAEILRLQELDAFKTRLYTNITHEFRTPLTIILGMVRQVREDPKKWFNEGLQMIARNGLQLLNLVNQMLDLSKLDKGKLQLKPQPGEMTAFD